ncbi:MAG: hypothetical protein LBI28_05635 [Treponema sp.]|nr:hypothetical protein [Treponema sp.]
MTNDPNTIQEFDENCVIIKVRPETVRGRGSVYGAVRWAWIANLEKISRADYVLAVQTGTGGKVIGVYKPTIWYKATAENDKRYEHFLNEGGSERDERRIAFQGEEAEIKIKEKYFNKYIPYEYRKPGMAAPVLYVNIDFPRFLGQRVKA